MSKAQFISLTTLVLFFSILILFAFLNSHESEFNNLLIDTIASEEVIYQLENVFLKLDQALNAVFTIKEGDGVVNVSLQSYLSADMNPDQEIKSYDNFLELYNNYTRPDITHYFNDIIDDVGNNEVYDRMIEPVRVGVSFDYSTDEIIITNVSQAISYAFYVNCEGSFSVSWTVYPSGDDLIYYVVHPNGTYLYFNLDFNNNYHNDIYCDSDNLEINYIKNSDEFSIDYSKVENMDFELEASFNNTYGDLFRLSSPYSLSNVAVSYANYTVSRGFT